MDFLKSLASTSLIQNFTFVKKVKSLKRGIIKEIFKDAFNRFKRPELFDDGLDYDKFITNTAAGVMRRTPVPINREDQDDLIIDVLNQILTKKTVKQVDSNKINPIKFFAQIFKFRMITELDKFIKRKIREQQIIDTDDFSLEEQLDFKRKDIRKPSSPSTTLQFKELIEGLSKLLKRKGNNRAPKLLKLLMEGNNNKEIAEVFKISPAAVTNDLKKFKDLLLLFAKETNNDLLTSLTQKILTQKRRTVNNELEAKEETDPLVKFFKQLKKLVKSVKAEKHKFIKKTVLKDRGSEDFLFNLVNENNSSIEELNIQTQEFNKFLEEQSDVVDVDGSLVCLQVLPEDIRPLSR